MERVESEASAPLRVWLRESFSPSLLLRRWREAAVALVWWYNLRWAPALLALCDPPVTLDPPTLEPQAEMDLASRPRTSALGSDLDRCGSG